MSSAFVVTGGAGLRSRLTSTVIGAGLESTSDSSYLISASRPTVSCLCLETEERTGIGFEIGLMLGLTGWFE